MKTEPMKNFWMLSFALLAMCGWMACSNDSEEPQTYERMVMSPARGSHQSFSLPEMKSGIASTAIMPDWISSLVITLNDGTPSIAFDIADNMDTIARSTQLAFKDNPGNLYLLHIEQQGAKSQTMTVNMTANGSGQQLKLASATFPVLKINNPADWLSILPDDSQQIVCLTATPNTTGAERTCQAVIIDDDRNWTMLHITQNVLNNAADCPHDTPSDQPAYSRNN